MNRIDRRQFNVAAAAATAGGELLARRSAAAQESFQLNYMLASCMYGYLYLGEILPQVSKTAAKAIDIWPKVHGNQREQMQDLGLARFEQMLTEHEISLGCLTRYDLGPFGLRDEFRIAQQLGCETIVTGARGPKGLKGGELKSAVQEFIERLKPYLAAAEDHGVTIAIENHANSLIESADSMKWLAELRPSKHLAVAFAPYHLPQDSEFLGKLIESLGDSIQVFYAWEHGEGCHTKLPKEQELMQLPGRGTLDFRPLLAALKTIHFQGWTEIFMHPVPRGIPILETAAAVSDEINQSRGYLESLLEQI